jgi:hypothetical protein
MNYIQSIINQNSVISKVASAPASLAGATEVYISIGGWPKSSTVDRIILSANNSIANVTVTVLTDSALYRAASATNKPLYIAGSASGSMANNMLVLDLSECFVEDVRNVGVLHLRISAASITTGTVFTVRAEGKRSFPTTANRGDSTGIARDLSFKVVHEDSGTGALTDITSAMTLHGGENFPLNNANDYVYVGSEKPQNKWLFEFSTVSTGSNSALTAEVWNGSAWVVAGSVLDNTSDGMSSPGSFRFDGVVLINAATWVKRQINDSINDIINDVTNGNTQPPTLLSNPLRFWARFKINITSGEARFQSIRPVE